MAPNWTETTDRKSQPQGGVGKKKENPLREKRRNPCKLPWFR